MLITNYSQINYAKPSLKLNNHSKQPLCTDTVSFSGHAKGEKIFYKGFKQLIQQTAFDREPETKKFVCNYIYDNFRNKDKINIVSAACSTGEEPLTYSMRLYNIRNKVDILGIDLGKKAIKQAQSKRYVFEIPKNNYNFEREVGIESPYTDTYLTLSSDKGLTADQKYFKALFNEFFTETGEKIKTPFLESLQNSIIRRNGGTPLELERKAYRLKEGKADNCHFEQGDVMHIDKILNGKKVDIISFCNALYHITTTDLETGRRTLRKDAIDKMTELFTKFKNCLNENGIVVFGENEAPQLADKNNTVSKVMKKLGFEPLNSTKDHDANVWKKN